jgi:TonB family protein
MSAVRFGKCILAVVAILSGSVVQTLAQTDISHGEAVLSKLVNPSYPRIALAARITGEVELTLEIREDGTVQSASVVSGPPLLRQAALDSAQRSQFECRKCGETDTSLRLVYTFELAESENPCPATERDSDNVQSRQLPPMVIQSQNHVTLVDQTVYICDPASRIAKVRSIKCFFLWRCGTREIADDWRP